MRAAVVWGEVQLRRPRGLEGCLERIGRIERGGSIPHVLGDDHVVMISGAAESRLRFERREGAPAAAMLVEGRPGDVFTIDVPGPCPFRYLEVPPSLLAGATQGVPALRPLWAVGERGSRLVCFLAGELALQRAQGATASEAGLRGLLEHALRVSGGRAQRARRSGHAVVMRIRDHLCRSYAHPATLEELARLAGMCRFALARAFVREVGLPPHAFLIHVRVLRACEMIAAGKPLSGVALDVGFSDQSHLCRHFKRVLGVTPGAYAQATRPAGARSRLRHPQAA